MEKLRTTEDFLKFIPPKALEKLEPLKGHLDEVVGSKADFAHLKYHILDELILLKHVNQKRVEFRDQVTRGISHGWITSDDILEHPWMGEKMPDGLFEDIPTFDRVERGVRLHDIGRTVERMVDIAPDEHHFASLFVALQVDGDPIVCEAVLQHVLDVLPKNASVVSRHVRDLDRMSGSGYIGLIRALFYYNKNIKQMFEGKDEDTIVNEGIMTTFVGFENKANENVAKEFFWENIWPQIEAEGKESVEIVGALSKIILDRIFGRRYTGRKLDEYQKRVLKLDRNVTVVEPVLDVYKNSLEFKVKNTLDVLSKTRGGRLERSSWDNEFLTREESDVYIWNKTWPSRRTS